MHVVNQFCGEEICSHVTHHVTQLCRQGTVGSCATAYHADGFCFLQKFMVGMNFADRSEAMSFYEAVEPKLDQNKRSSERHY